MPAAIAIENLTKRYGPVTAVDDLSLEVQAGEFFGFLGPNGAGKTTTIHAMVGLATFEGRIRIFGYDAVRDYRAARSCIGLSPQEFNFDRYLTIKEVLVFNAGYYGIPPREAKVRADELLERFDLAAKRNQSFMELSGGMKRRLALARSLVHSPRILVLDEPTAGIDVELRLELWETLRELNRQGLTIFLTTHYLEEAEVLCSRIGILSEGKLVALDSTERLIEQKGQSTLLLSFEQPVALPEGLRGFSAFLDGPHWRFSFCEPEDVARILDAFLAQGLRPANLEIERPSLQDIFLSLTGRKG